MNYKSIPFSGLMIIIFSLFYIGCNKEDLPPIATFTINTEQGDIEDFFTFDASACTDSKDETSELMVRWDWESNGSWDTQYSTNKITQKKFSNTTTYTITLEVKNTRGLTSTTTRQLLITELTSGILTDARDGQSYKTKKIGDQWWMAENLNYETLTASYCYYDLPSNCNIYGRLYSDPAIVYACPDGWHLPTDEEWKEMERFLGMSESDVNNSGDERDTGSVGDKLKSVSGWELGHNGTNESGFDALPGGFWWSYYTNMNTYLIEGYDGLGFNATFWSSTRGNLPGPNRQWVRRLYPNEVVGREQWLISWRASIRCVKD